MLPKIGITANWLDPVWDRRFYIGKALQYAEDGMIQYVWRHGGLPVVLPILDLDSIQTAVAELDGVILSGGEDVSPTHWGETPRRPEWAGNPVRDAYEMALVHGFIAAEKPVFGICRGIQLMNVALGGTLYQDLVEDGAVQRNHRNPDVYDKLRHELHIQKPSLLFDLYKVTNGLVNTVHHQAVRELGRDIGVMARSDDGVVEAIFHEHCEFVVGVQWHPEWAHEDPELLPPAPLMEMFLRVAADSASKSG